MVPGRFVKYNWQTHLYEVLVQFRVGGPCGVECSFFRESEAMAYLSVRHIKC